MQLYVKTTSCLDAARMANPPMGGQVSPCGTSPTSHQVRVNNQDLCDPPYADHSSVHAGRETTTSTCRNKHEMGGSWTKSTPKKKSNPTDAAADVKHLFCLCVSQSGRTLSGTSAACSHINDTQLTAPTLTAHIHAVSVVPLLHRGLRGAELSPDLGIMPLVSHRGPRPGIFEWEAIFLPLWQVPLECKCSYGTFFLSVI